MTNDDTKACDSRVSMPPRVTIDLDWYADFLTGKVRQPTLSDPVAWKNFNLCSDLMEAITAADLSAAAPCWMFITRIREAFRSAEALRRVMVCAYRHQPKTKWLGTTTYDELAPYRAKHARRS
jgi:hypothetical protein